jgi:N-acetylglucosamine-6-phosphate deacetylase
MDLEGRIPGRRGLWKLTMDGNTVRELSCVEPGFDGTKTQWLTPGLFDLQINGIDGLNFTDDSLTPEGLARADQSIRDKGISRYCPTIITCSLETALAVLGAFRTAWDAGVIPGAWGIHLEGPWISGEEGFRGVHRLEHIRDATISELSALREAAAGHLRLITLAPERQGALSIIRAAVEHGITVSLGHTNASPSVVAAAIDAGARMSMHLFNGCAQLIDRHSNPIFSQLAQDSLHACFIADGHHVPLSTLKIGLRAKGFSRSILVSDIVHLSGLPDGEYEMGGNKVELRDGGIFVKGGWMLSGAARTLEKDVELLARQVEPGIEQAFLMATVNPAAALNDPSWAELAPGRTGPVAMFSWDGNLLSLKERIGF